MIPLVIPVVSQSTWIAPWTDLSGSPFGYACPVVSSNKFALAATVAWVGMNTTIYEARKVEDLKRINLWIE